MSQWLWIPAAYLLGAIPSSYFAGRLARGIDLRDYGSKNLGATNVYRILGWKWAIPVGLFDLAKGALPVALFPRWAGGGDPLAVLVGAAAVLGHMASPFVRFRGGKGVATAGGMFLALAPVALLIAAAGWAVLLRLTGYASLSSITTAALFPVWIRLTEPGRPVVFWSSAALAVLIIGAHHANIRRLLEGTENRFRTGRERSA